MGSILSPNSAPKTKGEDSSLIEIQEIPEDEHLRETQGNLKIDGFPKNPTDPDARQFVKTFQQLQTQKEQYHIQLHNEVIQWRLMYQRGVSNKFNHKSKVNLLIKEFVKLHEQLDEFLDQEQRNLERILPKPKSLISKINNKDNAKERPKNGEQVRDSVEITPEAMQRLVCFQRCNDQHILILTQVLSDIEDCKTFVKPQPATAPPIPTPTPDPKPSPSAQTSTESAQSSTVASSPRKTSSANSEEPSNRPITITVSTDCEENIASDRTCSD